MTDVRTYTQDHQDIATVKSEVMELFQSSKNDAKAPNYTANRLDLDSLIALTVHRVGGLIVSFSSILHRPLFNNSVRILNRYYQHPSLRDIRALPNGMREDVVLGVNQQIEIATSLGYDLVFISREGRNPAALRFWINNYDQEWTVSPYLHQVCAADCPECYQWIMYHRLTPGIDPYTVLNTFISREEFEDRYRS